MKIVQVELHEGNMLKLMKDKNVYAIKRDHWCPDRVKMEPISEYSVGDLTSGEVSFIHVEFEERS